MEAVSSKIYLKDTSNEQKNIVNDGTIVLQSSCWCDISCIVCNTMQTTCTIFFSVASTSPLCINWYIKLFKKL